MHEKQITATDFNELRNKLEDGRTLLSRPVIMTEWHSGVQMWRCWFREGNTTPAAYWMKDLRTEKVTYWRDAVAETAAPSSPAPVPDSPAAAAPFTVQVDQFTGEWKREEWTGDERCSVQVTEQKDGGWNFVLDCYYGPRQRLELTITQPWDRAVRTLVALLRADSVMEDYPAADVVVTQKHRQ